MWVSFSKVDPYNADSNTDIYRMWYLLVNILKKMFPRNGVCKTHKNKLN
jgi:hypothetical protein